MRDDEHLLMYNLDNSFYSAHKHDFEVLSNGFGMLAVGTAKFHCVLDLI